MHRIGILVATALLILTGLVFGLAPGLDLAAAGLFHAEGNRFIGTTPLGETLRSIGYEAPFWILGIVAGGWVLGRAGVRRWRLPSSRAVLFLCLTLALGPGLIVNTLLKDNSHRPRPVQTQEFGGRWEFRPWYRFDGQCVRNCSFVSGEASSAFWTLAPALLTPPPVQPIAVAASLVFGSGVAVLRMAFGGHYLSDSLMSALITILLVLGLHRAFFAPSQAAEKAPASAEARSGRDPDLRETGAPL